MKPGETVTVAGYAFAFKGARTDRGPNYAAVAGTFEVSRKGKHMVTLTPEKRIYDVGQRPTTEAAIHPTFMGDIYAVIGDPEGDSGAYVTRLYFNPLVGWMWTGALIMVAGGVISLSDRRHRVGAPQRRADAAAEPARA